MTVENRIEQALKDIGYPMWSICCPEESKPESYIVYNPELEEAAMFADDEDQEWVQHMQVHLFTKKSYEKVKKQMRKQLRDEGFVITDMDTFYEKDSGYYHVCISIMTEE